jgi:hypothetical protein
MHQALEQCVTDFETSSLDYMGRCEPMTSVVVVVGGGGGNCNGAHNDGFVAG